MNKTKKNLSFRKHDIAMAVSVMFLVGILGLTIGLVQSLHYLDQGKDCQYNNRISKIVFTYGIACESVIYLFEPLNKPATN